MKIIYVAGAYRAKSEWELCQNIEASRQASARLWAQGWAVISPHMNTAHFGGICPDQSFLDGDLEIIKRCDAIYMLKGWEISSGSVTEHKLAMDIGLDIFYEEDEYD